MPIVLVFSTLPDAESAKTIATTLVEEGLAACVTCLPGAHSVYRWQGAVESADEVMIFAKTSAAAYPALEARLQALHPYELPEIMALSPAAGLPAYLAWVGQSIDLSTDKDC